MAVNGVFNGAFTMAMAGTPAEKAEYYLSHADKFKLGELWTEASHEKTRTLSELSRTDLPRAIGALKGVDLEAIESLASKSSQLNELRSAINQTLTSGHKVFLCGCGATGRLSLKLEFLWRTTCKPEQRGQVIGFMAGGDLALIRSIESFEDHADFGERQLLELGFVDGDLMIGITEGGETSFVIGATEAAAQRSKNLPYFLYCNPSELLKEKVARSQRVIDNPNIHKICLAFGPMALSGSTRMQATTVQLLAVASCLLNADKTVEEYIGSFAQLVLREDFTFLQHFIDREVALYNQEKRVIYSTDEFGITILTDTTERSPTFSLAPFENFDDEKPIQSLCYFNMMGTAQVQQAWEKLLCRPPRALAGDQYWQIAGAKRILGYDFSDLVFDKRRHSGLEQVLFKIYRAGSGEVRWQLQEIEHGLKCGQSSLFFQHLVLKLLLNIHSTLVMGRLNRYEGNWMTWVKPSNGKLIDRSIRYIQGLAAKRGLNFTYEKVAHQVFIEMETIQPNEPIVLKVLGALTRSQAANC